MRIPKQVQSVARKVTANQVKNSSGVAPSGELCSAFPETCGLGA